MRICSAPGCGAEITACMGTTKAGDVLEAMQGIRKWSEVRELCPKCGSKAVFMCGEMGMDKRLIFPSFGW